MTGPIAEFMALMARCERMAPSQLRQHQQSLLAAMLAQARRDVPGYATRLDRVFAGDSVRFERWSELPVLTRDELLGNDKEHFMSQRVPEHLKPLSWSTTSGTSGQPLLVAKTRLAQLVSACLNERMLRWHNLDPRKPLALICHTTDKAAAYPDGRLTHGWALSAPKGPQHILAVATPISEQIDWLRRRRPAYLSAYPSIAAEIAATLGDAGPSLGIETVLTYGEALSRDQRATIEAGFAAKVVDAYSAQEIGFIAIECPASGDYHIPSETLLVEIVDDRGRPLPAGEMGDVLVTPIYNTVMPLIRYRIGDHGRMAKGRCACGRTLPRLSAIGGRSRDLFRFSDGSTRFANLHTGTLRACVPYRQFQLVQHSPTRVELIFIPADAGAEVDTAGLQELARRDLFPDVTIFATPVADIPRTAGHKFQRTVSLSTSTAGNEKQP
ncbi:hypothetical protein VSX64_11195 [Aurantimonas sp. C2-6-R+9]|uniref:phenylacetate--CoA ligase family protein n=1 Tax=unclassified Aurantimonas TaxID=2638230 RepID=UPI002E198EDD|nr:MULTISPECIES: hypothetical protein [unclassified Aurantimonas]MEC5291115.1 hypothetical protein [Aurantimonas sp. C2-3-R2]MEC5325291.1 hypothetical protein [Aurantimonas sp. A3-2-R12]MEC5381443.1 hypothetical protein [Aurantimonas sp. C2-6-R+9]MEC5412266.1 hypothetical protein [Aurantimonas sp. C2-4-R8]